MSECVFTLAQLGAVVLAHRAVEASDGRAGRLIVFAALLAAVAMLIRSAGAALIAAACLSLVKDRRWIRGVGFATVAAVCLVPWLFYARAHAPTPVQQDAQRGLIVHGYGDQFWMRRAGSASSGRIHIAELPGRVTTNIVDIVGRGAGGILVQTLLRGPDESGEEVVSLGGRVGIYMIGFGSSPANMAISFALSAIAVFGYIRTVRQRVTVAEFLVPISLAITVLWPWWTFRFVLPLSPFLFFYFIRGLQWPGVVPLARIVILSIIGLNLYDHTSYVLRASSNLSGINWLARATEVDETLDWMRTNLDKDAVIATTNPALVHLRTGHLAITLDTWPRNGRFGEGGGFGTWRA